jgi:acyl-CoA synthetase (AMP-forming)/AMP-acid ligase II/thioesterase domain-containing protein/acyl carrier protein
MRSSSCAALSAIAHFAQITPTATAIIEPDAITLSYSWFWDQIEALSRQLQEAGIAPGQRVAVLLPQGALQVLAVAGVLNQHVAVPLQTKTTTAEVESALRRLSPLALITSLEFAEETEAAIQLGVTVLLARNGQFPNEWRILSSDEVRLPPAETSKAIMFLITSATMGNSKLVPLSAENLDAGIESRRYSLRLDSSDRMLLMTSLCHIIGVENALAQFFVGGTVIATNGFDSSAYRRWLSDLKPTWYDCSPTIHQAALTQLRAGPIDHPTSLRFVQSAGAPLPTEVREELEHILDISVFNDYGMTEACPIAMDAFIPGARVPNSAGRSCGLEIGVIDSIGTLLPRGNEGEIVVRGAAVFSGYYNDPEATQAAFDSGWFKTGDLGRLDQGGNLFVTGRLKEMINRGGEKILPAEVDAVFSSHPSVLDAAAFMVPHPTLGEDVACAVVLRNSGETEVNARDLRRYAAERLATFKVPHRIHFVDQIPRGELGKPQRWLLAERVRYQHGTAPSPAEVNQHLYDDGIYFESLHEIWARILDRSDLGFDEDFFEAGGDSLAAINMLAEVDQRLGCETSVQAASFLDEPTLDHLMKLVGQPLPPRPGRDDPNCMQVFPVRKEGAGVELFCLPTEGREGLYYHRLATYLLGKIDLSIVRPANTFHRQELFSIEREGREVAEVVRRAQPEGPYYVAGLCYGGVVAIEAARQLTLDGQEVRVILFDVPVPGYPRVLLDWPIWVDRARSQWHRIWTSEHPGLRRNLRRLLHRVVWSALVPFRRTLLRFEHFSAVQAILEWTRFDLFPLYKVHPVDAPILHVLCSDEPSVVDSYSRFGWRRMARRGIEEHYVPLNHFNVLHESNLPTIAELIMSWCGVEREEIQVQSTIVGE